MNTISTKQRTFFVKFPPIKLAGAGGQVCQFTVGKWIHKLIHWGQNLNSYTCTLARFFIIADAFLHFERQCSWLAGFQTVLAPWIVLFVLWISQVSHCPWSKFLWPETWEHLSKYQVSTGILQPSPMPERQVDQWHILMKTKCTRSPSHPSS